MLPPTRCILLALLSLSLVAAENDTEPPATATGASSPAVSARTRGARGAYFSARAIASLGADGTARAVKSAGLNAAVIDFKDSDGLMNAAPVDAEGNASAEPDPRRPVTRELLARLDALGIYTIARIVCFSDPVLPHAHRERAVMDGRPEKQGRLWADWGRRNTWLDPYHPANQQMVIDVARQAEALGFHEVQLDYIRFPVDEATTFAVFPSQTEQDRTALLEDLLRRVNLAIEIPLGVDIFGAAAFRFTEQTELGQSPVGWVKHVQVLTPMLYMNGMSSYRAPGPRRAERLVWLAVSRLRERVGPEPVIRPFLQAFERGADHFTPEFIAEQVTGARHGGADGFLFWEPASSYAMVREARRKLRGSLAAFPPSPAATTALASADE